MINIFDRTLKIIARNHADTFLKLAFPNQQVKLIGTVDNAAAIAVASRYFSQKFLWTFF